MNKRGGTSKEKQKWHIMCNSFKQNKTGSLKSSENKNSRTSKMTEFAFIMHETLAPNSELI